MRTWWMSALAFFLFTCLLGGCIEEGLTPRSPTPGVGHFQIATFNAHLERYNDEDTIAAIGEIDADIICLQETNQAWEDVITERYGDEYPYRLFHHEGNSSSGLGIISRYPLEDMGVIEHFEDFHPGWLLVADTPLGEVQVLIVHLRPPYSSRGGLSGLFSVDEDHEDEIRHFTAPLSLKSTEGLPTVVLGDFNSGPDGEPLKYLEDQGFTNVLPLYQPGQETWRHDHSFAGQSMATIDHILFDQRLTSLNAHVIYEGNSDHLPVIAHFEESVEP